MTQIGYYRYEGFDLATKYGWIHGSRGYAATEPARVGLGNTANAFAGSDDALRVALRQVGVEWQGNAAERAGAALRGAADWSVNAGTAGSAGSGAVDAYGTSFEGLRSRISAPPAPSWFDAVATGAAIVAGPAAFHIQSDIQGTVQQYVQQDTEANAALRAHEGVTRQAVQGFPTLDGPPAITSGGGGMPGTAGVGAGVGGGAGLAGVGPSGAPVGGSPIPGASAAGVGSGTSAAPPVSGGGVAGSAAVPLAAGGAALGAVRPPTRDGALSPRVGGSNPGGVRQGPAQGWNPPSPAGRGPGGLPRPGGDGDAVAPPPRPRADSAATDPHPNPRAQGTRGSGAVAAASGTVPPWLAGGSAGRPDEHEHRNRFYIPTDEAFDVELPPHVPPVINGPE